jgi:phosphatidylinositol alpha 1,6-mannosyltransferase
VDAPLRCQFQPTLRAWQPDIVHLAGPFVLGAYGLRVARELGIPVAAHYQTDLVRFARHYGLGLFAKLTWRRLLAIHNACDINFAPTASIAGELRSGGMRNVQVVGRGVDTALFHPGKRDPALRAAITGNHDGPVLAYVGRVAPEKGLDLLIDVADSLPS